MDQHGSRFVQIEDGDVRLVLPAQTMGNVGALGDALTRAGIPAYTTASRTAIQRLAENSILEPELVCIAAWPGWYAGAYVMPDGRVVGRPDGELLVAFSGPGVPLARAGSFTLWWVAMRRFGRGQTNVIFACCAGLAGSALDLFPFDTNLIFESAGATSQGKSSMAQVMASLSGALLGSVGSLALSYQASKAGLEEPFLARQFTTVPVDEATAAASDVPARGRVVGDVTMFVAQGLSKLRYGSGEQIPFKIALFGTANRSLADAQRVGGAAELEVDVLAARLITIPIDAGAGLGCWDSVPARCSGPAEAVAQLRARLERHHGWALERFLKRLARARRRDEAALRAQLQAYSDEFIQQVEAAFVDDVGRRRALKFAIIYAVGRLACEWRVLPFQTVGPAIAAVFKRAEALRVGSRVVAPPTVAERIAQHAAAHRDEIVDLDVADLPSLSSYQLDRTPGFLKMIAGRRYLLLRKYQLERLFGPATRRVVKELEVEGRLLVTDKLQAQHRVRREAAHDRLYAILIEAEVGGG